MLHQPVKPLHGPRRRALACCLALSAVAGLSVAALADPVARYLLWRSSPVLSKPSLKDGEERGRLYWGRRVQVLETQGDWLRIEATGEDKTVSGWVHATALSDAPQALAPTKPGWLAAGAKGFTKAQVEIHPQALAHAKARTFTTDSLKDAGKYYPDDRALDEFLKEGDLGLYRPDWPSLIEGVVQP